MLVFLLLLMILAVDKLAGDVVQVVPSYSSVAADGLRRSFHQKLKQQFEYLLC
jgi:hypothetical protein